MIVALGYALLIVGVIILVTIGRLLARSIREISKWDRRNDS